LIAQPILLAFEGGCLCPFAIPLSASSQVPSHVIISLFFGPMIGLWDVPGIGPRVELSGGGSARDWCRESPDCAPTFIGGTLPDRGGGAKLTDVPGAGKGDTEGAIDPAGANPLAYDAWPGCSIVDVSLFP